MQKMIPFTLRPLFDRHFCVYFRNSLIRYCTDVTALKKIVHDQEMGLKIIHVRAQPAKTEHMIRQTLRAYRWQLFLRFLLELQLGQF